MSATPNPTQSRAVVTLEAIVSEFCKALGEPIPQDAICKARRLCGLSSQLELMDAGVTTAARLSADVRIAGKRKDFDLPIWRDRSGDLRIGLPKLAPDHSGDMDQLVFSVGELLAAVGEALQRDV